MNLLDIGKVRNCIFSNYGRKDSKLIVKFINGKGKNILRLK